MASKVFGTTLKLNKAKSSNSSLPHAQEAAAKLMEAKAAAAAKAYMDANAEYFAAVRKSSGF